MQKGWDETMRRVMLTTVDNPYDPFDNFTEWYEYDTRAGHHSTAFLARLTFTSDQLSEEQQQLDTEKAIDEIVFENVSGVHRKVTREIPETSGD